MKKILIPVFIFLFFCSCDKFLVENPRTSLSTSEFFKTESDFNLAVNGAYAALRGMYGSRSAWTMGEMRSDNTHYDYKPSDAALAITQRNDVANFMNDQFSAQTSDKWNTAYVTISRANAIIDQIAAAKFSDSSKNAIEGQAKFMRALSYFELVRFYGDVPLYLHVVNSTADVTKARTSKQEVYDQIIADARDASDKLRVPVFPQTGRATKGSALTLLADVYITLKRFADAEPLLKQVTQLNYQLMPNYADAFDPAKKINIESIFEIQYNASLAVPQASEFIYNFIPRMSNSTGITGLNQNTITDLGGFNTPTQDLISTYEAGDKRLDASIAIAEGSFNASNDFVPSVNTAGGAVKSIVGYTAPAGKVGRPFPRKYLHTHTQPRQTNDNWPVYRYAEVLLMLAECLNELNRSAEALPYLKQVRERAGLAASSETNQVALRAIILHERRVELAFENKRWLDLVRTGNAVSVMKAYGIAIKALYTYLPANSYNVDENSLLFPIPYAEMQLNPLLTQNKGY
ncbi:RagB/SusD family nutrient uptake outer membrane protein [Chitinophaga niabensis]|uniref:Starch-binding associating with outer membrane n=1 Tax=Chitinophaga niabensis TaxID=536979 RepID=A0A1N6D0K8_9BACT|nr:RagB/SusD family nutrient uptake outer membrane protein [Chitinophaga niabensis]SIN64259.1 Starch-binding associating with outer membrane [Chitinophaga niabensis]